MNQLNLQGGGHPLTIEDLQFLQDALRGGIATALAAFISAGNESFLIYGGEKTPTLTPGYVDVSAAYIYHGYEIWVFDGAPNIPDADIFFEPLITYQSPSPVTYASGALVDVKEERKMTIGNGTPPPEGVLYTDLKQIWQCLRGKGTPWVAPTYQLAVAAVAGLTPAWRVLANGQLVMRGRISVNMASIIPGSTAHNVLQLPEQYAPVLPRTFLVTTNNGKLLRILVALSAGVTNISINSISGASFADDGFAGETVQIALDSVAYVVGE